MPDTNVVACDTWTFARDLEGWKNRLPTFDSVVTNREMVTAHSDAFSGLDNIIYFPILFFRAMHPDLCHVHVGEAISNGPLMEYHSAMIFAAYKSGIAADRVPELFCHDNFNALGFYDLWASEKEGLLDRGAQEGVDLRAPFRRWARRPEPFMHSFNHPTINVIYDTSKALAESRDWEIRESPHRPHDTLANSAVFPVYPELANRLGLAEGSYCFKPSGVYETLTLREFVNLSYAEYDRHNPDALTCFSPEYARAMTLFAEIQ
jgi:hypothetical protein